VGEKCSDKFWPRIRLPRNSSDLLHAANLRHGTDGFTSPPKEGVLRIFSPLKIRRLRPGLNPRTWVPKASTLPLDHRSRIISVYSKTNKSEQAVTLLTSSERMDNLVKISAPTHIVLRFLMSFLTHLMFIHPVTPT